MKLSINELRHLIRQTVKELKEEFKVNADDELDIGDPTIIWNKAYDMDDQETSTKVANRTITIDPEEVEMANNDKASDRIDLVNLAKKGMKKK